jgi:cytidine deaminase
MTHRSPEPLDDATKEQLLEKAREAANHAYIPYSQFPVGAAILTDSGEIVTGANIENASYGLTICAERVAAVKAAYEGARRFRAIAITAPNAERASPCGACRQVLFEFVPRDGDTIVILDGRDGPTITSVRALLPGAFGPADLGPTAPADS